jgi:SAM-dependent methyltransferase
VTHAGSPKPSARRAGRPRGHRLDCLVRSSWLGRRVGWLRKASPVIYARLRSIYQRVVAGRRTGGLSDSQQRALDEFLAETPDELLALGVLEIGADVGGLVLKEMVRRGVPHVVGINPAISEADAQHLSVELPEGSRLLAVDVRESGLPSRAFGAIFSVAVLEHLLDLPTCLAEMHRLLVPGGRVYAAFGPIWSSSLGHHVFAEADGVQLRHWDPERNPIDDYAHLLVNRAEMRDSLARVRTAALADAAVEWIYDGRAINRLFFDDYVESFSSSPLDVIRLTTEREHVPARLLDALRRGYSDRSTFDVRNAVVVLERAADAGDGATDSRSASVMG